ncbi:flavin reductase family protein [Streptomyces sp. CA-210063]|uniref:flavin reductase family protein n=1 Tax=Streptomyces sp. CA-210063 TaxID=2801029 RepID=UPI00214A8C06|nr:flavin reductase family protein [Streptomyces sp. CA-210063]UUU37330.1 flavin reductase family protein [Streptomyces sp. CA-210063]
MVTALDVRRPHGTTVSAFASPSLTPPRVLVSLDNRSPLLAHPGRLRHGTAQPLQPYKVVENFLQLETLAPGRIDLASAGPPRAPSSTHPAPRPRRTAHPTTSPSRSARSSPTSRAVSRRPRPGRAESCPSASWWPTQAPRRSG